MSMASAATGYRNKCIEIVPVRRLQVVDIVRKIFKPKHVKLLSWMTFSHFKRLNEIARNFFPRIANK